jgi:predicted esterase
VTVKCYIEQIPRLAGPLLIALLLFGSASPAQDIADVPCEELRLSGNEQQRYFLIGAKPDQKAPDPGLGLLLVLPGGDGSAEFNPFVKRIWQNALPEGYLVAQLIAVPSDNKNQIVWPTSKDKDPKQKFSTEEFIANVVKEVKLKHKIDDGRVHALGWSSGGPAVYAAATMKDTPLRGAFVAMSVFFPAKLTMAGARGQRFYLLQSPQDQVTRYVFAENAKKQLAAAGAKVELKQYEGGHGWQGNVFGNIREGIDWLSSKQ